MDKNLCSYSLLCNQGMLTELSDAQFTYLELEVTVFAGILSSVTTSKEREGGSQLERTGKRTPGNRADVNRKGEKQRQRGTEGSHVRQPEAASAQGVWVTLHNKR